MLREVDLDQDTLEVLRPDDYLMREYGRAAFEPAANLFIAYYRSQRAGPAPHSPLNCLVHGQNFAASVCAISSLQSTRFPFPV